MTNRNWKYIVAGLLLSILSSVAVAQDARINRRESWARDLSASHVGADIKLNGLGFLEAFNIKYSVAYYLPLVMASVPQTENPDIKAVRDTVLVRFKDAFDANDVKELEKVWRGMQGSDKEAMNRTFTNKNVRSIRITDQCDGNPVLKGDFAELVCKETIVYTTDDVNRITRKITYKLQKINDIWYVMERVVK